MKMTKLTPLETECIIETLNGVLTEADREWLVEAAKEALEILEPAYYAAEDETIPKERVKYDKDYH